MLQLAFFVSGPQPEKIMTEAILYVCWFIYLLAVFTFPFQKTKTSKTTKRKKKGIAMLMVAPYFQIA